ncbi:MAG: hypothetical protein FWD45_01255 [Coriobacteriia bacterium]|nr:hypothetical protein [Coriobacteriia bacterium]
MVDKNKRITAFLLIAVVGVLMLYGCDSVKVSGRYSFVSMESEGFIVTAEALEGFVDTDDWYIDFDRGEFEFSFYDAVVNGTYTQDGTSLSLIIDDVTVNGEVEGNTVTISFTDYYDAVFVFEKK